MSSDEDDLFGGSDSDDTAELIKAASTSKKEPPKKKHPPAAAARPSDGLFDSDSDDDDNDDRATTKKQTPLSKREKLEALARKKKPPPKHNKNKSKNKDDKETGYDSGNSYDSETFERTAEDDAFIDTTGEDADAVNELYAEQNFGDVRPDQEKKKKKRKGNNNDDNNEPDNPIMAAVHRMKKKKRVKKSQIELEDEMKLFLHKMDQAADQDETAVRNRQPAVHKLSMLNSVMEQITKKDCQHILIMLGLLSVIKRWIQPLPNGQLGNVTVRSKLQDGLFLLGGEITSHDLKQSELGKTVMVLLKHRSETPKLKQQWRKLVENWSRPIFQKSSNMRDLDKVDRAVSSRARTNVATATTTTTPQQQDLDILITMGKKSSAGTTSGSRVSVPYSKGFAYSVRPEGRGVEMNAGSNKNPSEMKRNLQKRMMEKSRPKGKNQRSANISIEGRKTK